MNFMKLCLAQAELAMPSCHPNPAVGAVIVSRDGEILGIGHTQPVGLEHAEIVALRNARALGKGVEGATMYVSLEPCAHYGRTGPCAQALIEAKLAKVVASVEDPNPKVSGKGFNMLREAGIDVEVGPGGIASKELNKGFFSRFIRKTPWIRLKVASSIDGRTALGNGVSQWITGPLAREAGHTWRARSAAILTGIGTILKDDPWLNTHGKTLTDEPLLAIVDSQLKTPLGARLFEANRPVLIFTASDDQSKREALEAKGAEVIFAPVSHARADKVNLHDVLADLARREVGELHVEAGATLNGALIQENMVDEIIWYVAPKILGDGLSIADIGTHSNIAQCPEFKFVSVSLVGEDICIIARNIRNEFI